MDKVLSLKRKEAKAKFTIEEFDSVLTNLANDNSEYRPKIDDLNSQSSQNIKIDSDKLLITEQKLTKMLSTLSEVKIPKFLHFNILSIADSRREHLRNAR